MSNKNDKTKRVLVQQNITMSKIGAYAQCQIFKSIKAPYCHGFVTGEQTNICNVFVINKHPIDVASEFCLTGLNAGIKEGLAPVAMCVVNRMNFTAANFNTSEGFTDEAFNLRTNYCRSTEQGNPFPVRENECVYNRAVTVIRDQYFNILTFNNLYRFSVITASPVNKPALLDENRMNSRDFLTSMSTLETIFQTAIACGNNVLLLTPFGHTDDQIPQEDIVKIYNALIFKYQHRFKYIIVCVAPWYGTELFNLFNDGIILPQELCDDNEDDERIIIANNKTKSNKKLRR